MKKNITIAVAILSTAFLNAQQTGPDFHPTQSETKNDVLRSYTTGDQTDAYAIGLDTDQLDQEIEVNALEKNDKTTPKQS